MSALTLLIILIGLALIFNFLNGFNDSANIVATMIASRAMTARAALTLVAIAEFTGPFVLGVAVAKTVATEVASPQIITIAMVMAALISASLWNCLTGYFGIPSSSSHALVGGILGAVAIGSGLAGIQLAGVWKIALALFISPLVGFAGGLIVMFATLFLVQGATPKANIFFKQIQIPTAIALALSHGGNDAQKTMGVITLGLLVLGFQESFVVPWWVILISAGTMAAGTATGGWRIIHTLGGKFYRIRPIHSFASQLTSGLVVLGMSLLGGPVSTSQVVSSAILGVGAAQRRSQVRWGVMSDILVAWLLTIPAAAGMAALLYFPLKFLVE
jgi:PiT family inorganic phosphate transporter